MSRLGQPPQPHSDDLRGGIGAAAPDTPPPRRQHRQEEIKNQDLMREVEELDKTKRRPDNRSTSKPSTRPVLNGRLLVLHSACLGGVRQDAVGGQAGPMGLEEIVAGSHVHLIGHSAVRFWVGASLESVLEVRPAGGAHHSSPAEASLTRALWAAPRESVRPRAWSARACRSHRSTRSS